MTERRNAYATVDVTELPLVVVRVIGPLREESYNAYLQELLEAILLRDRVLLRLHAGPLSAFPPRFVHKSVSWMKEHQRLLESHVAAVSVVVDSSVLRMAVHALVWASRPPFPMSANKSSAEADSWLHRHLKFTPDLRA